MLTRFESIIGCSQLSFQKIFLFVSLEVRLEVMFFMNYLATPIIPLIDQSHLRNDIMFKQFCPSLKYHINEKYTCRSTSPLVTLHDKRFYYFGEKITIKYSPILLTFCVPLFLIGFNPAKPPLRYNWRGLLLILLWSIDNIEEIWISKTIRLLSDDAIYIFIVWILFLDC